MRELSGANVRQKIRTVLLDKTPPIEYKESDWSFTVQIIDKKRRTLRETRSCKGNEFWNNVSIKELDDGEVFLKIETTKSHKELVGMFVCTFGTSQRRND